MRGMVCALLLLAIAASARAADVAAEFVPIFNGKDLTGWKVPAQNDWWTASDGALVGQSDAKLKGSNLYTKKAYKDFELAADFRFAGDIDSGIFLRKPELQVQIGISRSLKIDKTGSIYVGGKGYVGNAKGVEKVLKPGEWNTFLIRCKGDQMHVKLNGADILDYQIDKHPKAGPIGLQIHPGVKMKVEFRSLKIRELD